VAKLSGALARLQSSATASVGLMTFLTAVRYGVRRCGRLSRWVITEKYLGEVDGLDAPLLMHLAEEDEFISSLAQAEIKTVLARKSKATVYSIRVRITPSLAQWGTLQCRGSSARP